MVARFLLVTGPEEALAGDPVCGRVERATAAHELTALLAQPALRLFANDDARPIRLSRQRGAILGSLFRKSGSHSTVAMINASEEDAILASNGAALGDSFWGNYIAVLADQNRAGPTVARAPFGGLPAYALQAGALTFVASHIDILFAAAGRAPSIDWTAIARHLIAPNLRASRTCLEEVSEIIGGFRVTIGTGTPDPQPFWSPWPFTLQGARIDSPEDAVEFVRRVTMNCVAALATEARHVVLGISGGLDSSIVAACLAQTATSVSCLTLYSTDESGDERPYARQVADHLGLTLFEEAETVDRVDVTRSDATHLPRPIARSFAQSGDRSNLAVAERVGADGFISGGGGDNVFCYVQSAVPVADRMLTSGLGRDTWRTARDISGLADCSIWAALRSGAERAWIREHQYRWKPQTGLLDNSVLHLSEAACRPIWFDMPEEVLPGSSNHVAWIVGTHNHIEGYYRERSHPTFWPLLAQPVIELCLRVPSWMWCAGGHNRMIARRAFADLLPANILARRTKGTPDSFMVELFEHNREGLAEMLEDGMLANRDLIDIPEILRQLRDTRPVEGLGYWRIMALADVEAWLRAVKDQAFLNA